MVTAPRATRVLIEVAAPRTGDLIWEHAIGAALTWIDAGGPTPQLPEVTGAEEARQELLADGEIAAALRAGDPGDGALARAVAEGNLEHRVEIKGRDELADVGAMLETMNGKLSAMVAEIRSSAVRVGNAGQQVASGSQALSQRTDEQAASLRQTVATVSQLSAAVASNAEAAQQLDGVAGKLRVQAEAGGEAMRATVGSMAALAGIQRKALEAAGVMLDELCVP